MNSWSGEIEDIWLEMDSGEYEKQIPQPCFFFNASKVKNGTDVDEQLLLDTLNKILDYQQLQLLWPNLKEAIHRLPSEVGLFQIGVMLARNNDRVRIFTAELTREQTRQYLLNIGWTGSFARLEDLFQLVHPYSEGQYILDFDVSQQGISKKIGINFGVDNLEIRPSFLENLVKHQLCTDVKRRGVLAWPASKGSFLGSDYGYAALINDVSHFKASCSPEENIKVKAYLRFAGVYLKEIFAGKSINQVQSVEKEVEIEQLGNKEMQDVFKQIAKKSMLDKDYRELCLKDSKAAIQTFSSNVEKMPDIIFLEEEPEIMASDCFVYILPPFLKPSWLTSK